MNSFTYTLLWVVLTLFPAITAWNRRWLPFVIYAAGWLIFLYTVLQKKDGWEDLADIATLIVVVLPVYLIASIAWLMVTGRKRRNRRTR